jgi:hypothetical protein
MDGVASVDHAEPSKRWTFAEPSRIHTFVVENAHTWVAAVSPGAPSTVLKPPLLLHAPTTPALHKRSSAQVVTPRPVSRWTMDAMICRFRPAGSKHVRRQLR